MADWPYTTARWQRLRKAKLSEAPLCQTCERRGRKVVAEHVDHVVAIKQGGDAFPAMDGLRALCAPCHSIKTNALDRAGGKGVAIKGCDLNGLPLDPDHPFLAGITPSRTGGCRSKTGGVLQSAVSSRLGRLMGLRGPGAKPMKKKAVAAPDEPVAPFPGRLRAFPASTAWWPSWSSCRSHRARSPEP